MNSVELGLIVAVAAAVSAGIILVLLPLLQRYALAHPNARSSHRKSTPQGGGIAVIAATIGVAAGAVAIGLMSRHSIRLALAGVCRDRIHRRWSERSTISGPSRSRRGFCCRRSPSAS